MSGGSADELRPITVEEARAVLEADNAPASSDVNVSDYAGEIIAAADESFLSTLGDVHAEHATIEEAAEFIATGYVNTISLDPGLTFTNLRVHEAETVTNDKITPLVASYSIEDSLPNITVAPQDLLAGADSYHIDESLTGTLRVDEALAWYRSDNYVQPSANNSVSFEVADNADVIVAAISEPDARTGNGRRRSGEGQWWNRHGRWI